MKSASPRIYILLVALVIAWALNTVFAKLGLHYMPPIWLVASRLTIGAIAAFIMLAALGRLKIPKKKDLTFIISIGLIQMSLFQLFFNYGMVYVHAGRASILTYSTPIWVTPIAVLFFGEKLTKLKLLGLILGIGGIVVLFSPGSFDWHDSKVMLGNGLLLMSALCWTAAMLHTRYGTWHSAPIELLPWQLLVSAILPLILASKFESTHLIHWNATLISVILFSGVIATAIGYWMSVTVSKALPVTTTSLSLLSVPILTLLLSAWMLHEPLTANNILAASLIIAGLACIALPQKLK